MARRYRTVVRDPAERSSIGDSYVKEACDKLNGACQRTVAMMTHYQHTRETTLPMLFDDSVIDKMTAVRSMVAHDNAVKAYEVGPGIHLSINYTDARLPSIVPAMLKINRQRAVSLLEHVAAVKAVHDRFEEVKAVLRYCNRNCTPGAIRYNFPQALALCPTAPALRDMEGVPQRHVNPPTIGSWIQAVKDATATLAQLALMPADVQPRDRKLMWLTFNQQVVHPGIDAKYYTDIMHYNL